MKTAIRRILMTLAWVGLLLGRLASADDWAARQSASETPAEVIPRGESKVGKRSPPMPDSDLSIVGETQMPIGGIFGDTPPAACEFCGGGGCLPPKWSFDMSVSVMSLSRANNQRLGANSLPAGPLSAGSVITTVGGLQQQVAYEQYLNDAVQQTELEVHTPGIIISPMFGLQASRFLGRDGEQRDHFVELAFNGLSTYTNMASVTQGALIPRYDTKPFEQIIPAPAPKILNFYGSLISPFPFYLPVNGNQAQLIAPNFSLLGENYDKAFNRSDTMLTNYSATFNEWELNYRIDGHNQPDQLVMNPNGHWYRQCQSGYYYSYFFGMKSMVINENFDYLSSGSQFAAVKNADGTYSPGALLFTHEGRYSVHSYNTLLGLQTGGKLEYRFCRWTFDTHGNTGMFLNFARADSHIQTNFDGPNLPTLSDGSTVLNTDNSFSNVSSVAAFAGGFGVEGSYKIRPNIVGHVGYDMLWIGDLARAPEQMVFSSVPENARTNINTKGSAFYNGFKFDVEWDW